MIMNLVKPILTLIALAFTCSFAASPDLRAQSMEATGAAVKMTNKTPGKTQARPMVKPASPATEKTPAKTADKAAEKPASIPASDLTPTQEDKLLALLNTGTSEDLTAISGIAATRADAIVGARPFQKVHEVILVPGVGEATFERILKHGKTLTRPAAKPDKS